VLVKGSRGVATEKVISGLRARFHWWEMKSDKLSLPDKRG